MVYEICAALATLVFILIGIYLIRTLVSLKKSLDHLNEISSKLDHKIDPIGLETIKLLKKSNDITETVHEQLEAFNPICQSVYHVGNALEEASASLSDSYHNDIHEKKKQRQSKLEDLIELAAAGISFWQQLKKRR